MEQKNNFITSYFIEDINKIKKCLKTKEEEKAAIKIQAISRGKQGRKEAGKLRKKERLNVIIKNFEDFIKKIEDLEIYKNTTELNGVIKETLDFLIKTNGYMIDGTITKDELKLTIFEFNDISNKFIKVLDNYDTITDGIQAIVNISDEDDPISIISNMVDDFNVITELKNEWMNKVQHSEEDKDKLNFINKYMEDHNVYDSFEDLEKKLKNFDMYEKFIERTLNISKGFIIIFILSKIENPDSYKEYYEKLLQTIKGVDVDKTSKDKIIKIKSSIEKKKAEEEEEPELESESEEEPEPEEEEEEEDLSEVLKKIFELHGINNDTINGINNDIINLYNYEESSYGKRRRRKFGSNSSETREGMTPKEAEIAYELSQEIKVVSEEEIKGKILNEVKKKGRKSKKSK